MTPPEKGKEVKTPDKADKPAESVFDQFILVKDEKKDNGKPAETKAADAAPAKAADAAPKAADAAPAKVDVADAGDKKKQDGPATSEDIERLKKAVEEADKLDPKKAIADVLEAQTHSIELLDVLMRPSQKQNPEKQEQLKTVFEAVEGKGWENYLKYLAPGSARAALALAQIGTGDDKSIREGEKGLVEAVKLRPELALNPEFQKRVADAYRQMAESRDDAGKPPWDEPIKMPEMAGGKDNTATIQRVQELMGSANQAYGEKGIDAALPVFKQAQDATKEIDTNTILKEHVELFVERMQRDRQISALERQGRDTQPLVDAQEQHLEKQWQKYGEYLLPASVVSNIGLAEINSGKPELMSDGRLRLGQAIELRPEMQFNNDYAKVVKGAFENYYSKNPDNVTTNGGAPVGPGGLMQPADLDPKFKQLDGKDIASHPTADLTQDKKLESYVWDDVTGPALTAGLLYLGYRQVKGQIQRYREAKAEREADERGSVKSIPGGDLLSPKDSGPDMPWKYTAEKPAAELVQGIDKFLEKIPAADRAALRQDLTAIDRMAPDVAKILAKQGIKSSDFQSMTTEEVARRRGVPAEDLQKLVDYKKMAKSLDDRLYKYNQPLQEALGIKDVRLRLSPTMHDAAGKFNFTNGFMDLRAQEIFAEHLSPELIGTLKHESRHVEQSRLIMRHLMGEELKGSPLTKEGQDKIFQRFVKAFPGVNQYDIDRNYFNKVLQEFASQPNGTDRLDAKDRARAKQLIESLKAPINYELEKLEKPVRKIIEDRNELRQEGAKEFANKHKLTPQNEAAWKALFGDKIPAEVDEIRKRGVTDADTQVLDKHLNERTYELANKVLEKYNSYAHEAEASRTGGKAIEETKQLFAETGRTIPPERGRGVLEQALKPIRFDLVDERTKIMEGMIHELKGKSPDIVSMIEYLDEKRPDGQKNVDFLFGKDKPKEIAALLEPQTKDLILREEHPQLNDERVAKILRDGIEKAHAAELAAAEKPAVDKPAVQSPADKPAAVEATAKDKLQIGATLLSESTISKMNERVTQVLPELNRVPEQAGNRLKNAVFDVLTQAGVNDSRISKDRTEIVFNKDAKESSVKYFTGEPGSTSEVTRKGADFVTASGAPVDAAKVKTQIVLPQSMMSGNPAELTRTVYDALLQQANRGTGDAADRAGIDRVVRSALRDNLPLPGNKPGGGVEVNDRLIGSQLPLEANKPVEIKVSDQGVRFAGVEREIPFKEVWGKHVEDLERELKNEQNKKEGKDEKRIAELEKSVASEKAFLAALSDPAHADHAKTVERARERLSEFRPTEAQVERLAKERGATGEMRSRLVALTVLLGAFLTSKAFGDEAKKDKPAAGSSTDKPGAALDKPAAGAATDKPATGTTAGAATDKPVEPSSETTDHRVRDVSDRSSEKQNLADMPNSQMMRTALERILPSVNEAIQKKNEGLSEKNQQAKIDENKLRLEWEKGEFGSESRRLWKEAQKFLEADSIHLMQAMDARGMKYPVGAPVGPAKSESGSGLKETDELFRDRLRAGKVKLDLGFHNLNAGDLPTSEETTKFLNTYMWVAEAGQQYSKAFIQGQATYLDHSIQSFANMSRSGNLEGWKAPKDATPEQLERWQVAAVPWMQTIAQVKDYSERVAAFNAATTTNGTDWPSLQGIFKKIHGLDGKDFSFPDDAIKDANFPGKVIRNADGSVKEVKLDLPANLDRTPENIAKMEKLEAWLKKYSPQVDQVSGEIAKAMMDDNKLLLWAEAGDLQTDKKVPGYELRNVNKDLKGNQSDVGKFVQLPDGGPDNKKQSEWKVKAVREDGSYDLVRSAPNGKEFNLKRYEFSTVACDKDGKPNPKGEYVKVQSYEDMLWARDYAYNNWDFLGSIQKAQHIDREAQVFHKNDFIPVVDNGRVRLLQAKNLDSWGSSQEGAKQTGNIAGAVVDVGMLAIGVGEARAAWLVAKESGAIAMRQIVKEGLKATWHIGLGATGFGKQAIVNHFGDAGRTFMQYRHYAIMADLTLQLAPKGLQEGLWNSVWATKGMPSVMETYSGLNNLTWFDKALKGVNQVYEGGQLVKYTPPVGLFPLVDYYYLADFSNTIARVGQQKQEWPKLVDAMLKQGDGYREGEKPLFLSNDRITPEEMKRIAGLSLTDYQEKLQARDQKGVAAAVAPDANGKRANDLMERSKEALFKPENDPSRQKLASDAVEVFRNPQASQEDRTAAAFLLLSMRKSDNVGEKIGGANGVTATEAFGQLRSMANSSTSPYVRMAAGDMLLKTARTADATTATLARSVGDLETRAKQNPADKQIAGELSATRKRLEEAEQFKKSVNYSSADYVSVLTSIVNNKNLPRAVRMEAIASPTGPRLAALMQQFRYEVEPQIQATSDIEKRTTQMAAIYGRDSVAMEKTLSAIAKNAGEDADLRALATQALSGGSLDRPTVNGRPLTPGDSMFIGTAGDVPMQGDGIQDRHAAVALTKDGQMMVRTVGTGDTWIVHPDGSSSKVGSDWTRIAAGDRVRLGDKDKGQDLFLGQERTESLARMGAEVKNNRDKQGAISQEYAQQITEQLKAKTDLASFSSEGERNTALVNKYRATLAAIEMGPSLTGGDVNQFNRMVADALAECTQASSPELAANALAKLTPERMASLSFTGMDAMREGALRLASGGGNEAKDLEFKRLMVERFPDIFKDGTTEQKVRARNMLECLLVPGADVAIGKQDPSINYPLYAAGDPALRISALNALTRIDSEKAAEVAKLKLFGGTYGGAKVEADVATVRMAALETLQKIQPMDLGAISLKALKTETDPAILAKLWDVEYQERRPDLDPVRMMREYEALRERLLQRSQPGLLEEGKRAMEAAGYKGMHHVDLVNKLQGQAYGGYKGDINSQEAKDARKALIYMIVHERVSQQAMATNLKQAMWVKGPEMAKEMAVPLEMAMLSSPAMYADARNELLSAYLSLKPIEGGVISKEESTMLYASMLENEVRRMPAKDGTDWLKYDKRESETLQLRLLQLIADQPTDKVLPIIEGMSGTEHPFPSVQAKINEVLGQLKGSTDLYKQAAEHEARFIRQEKEAGRTPTSDFGKAKNASQLADAMGAVLTSKDSDAAKVSKALYLGMNLSPVTRADDPRLVVLRMASRDSNETVRLVAAKLLNTSPNGGDKQRAAFVAADTIKNSPIPSLKKEAETLGKEIGAKDQKLMDRALAETVVAPRNEASARPQGGEGIDDVRNQRAFERVRRSLVSGPKAELTWDWEQWGDFTKKYKFNLLESGSFVSAQFEAARQVDENRGGLTSFFTRESTKEAERQAAKDAVVPKMWEQLNGLVSMAMEKGDLDPDGREARKALNYLLLDDALAFYNRDQAKALDIVVNGLEKMAKGNSPGRGDMEWVLKAALTEKPDLKLEHKIKLLSALDALGGDKGKLSNENVAGIVALAMEQEYRFMPKPGDPTFAAKVEYHKQLLGMIEKYGNRDLSAALNIYIQNHPDQSVRAKAAQVRDAIEQRSSAGVKALVSNMVADTGATRKFAPIRDAKDPRIPMLLETAQDVKQPIEQRNRAASILLSPDNKGVSAEIRRTAANSVVTNGLALPDLGSRYTTAMKILDHTNNQFTREDKFKAISTLADLSVRGSNEIAERSEVALAKLQGEEASKAMKALLDSVSNSKRGTAEEKAKAAHTLEVVMKLYGGCTNEQKDFTLPNSSSMIDGQAQLFRAAALVAETGNQELIDRYHSTISSAAKAPSLVPVTSSSDARLANLKDSQVSNDEQVKLSAALILSHADSTGANPSLKTEARKTVYEHIDSRVFETRRAESDATSAADLVARWNNIDSVLGAAGEAPDSFARSYTRMKQMELQGGKEKDLVPVYERLAQLSKERQAPQAASQFEQKAGLAKLISEHATEFRTADAGFKQAQQLATEATTSKQPAKLAEAEQKLNQAVQTYSTLAGNDSVFAADALTALGKFYASNGRSREADQATQKALAIYEAQAAKSLVAPDATPSANGSGETSIDSVLMRGAVEYDAAKAGQDLMARSVVARTGAFGEASVSAAEGYEKLADFYSRTGSAFKGAPVLQTAVSIYQNYPGMEAKVGQASQQLARAYEATGDYQKAEDAYESGIQAMMKPNAIVSQQEVLRHMTTYIDMCRRHGRADKAAQWSQKMSQLQKPGTTGSTKSMLPFS